MTDQIITRQEAKANGLTRYFTGKICKHGHIAGRVVANGACIDCIAVIEKRYRENNHEHFRELRREAERKYRDSHREKVREKWRKHWHNASIERKERHNVAARKWAESNPDKVKERIDRWRKANPDKVRAKGKRWRDANPEKVRVKNKKYKTANRERLAPINLERVKQWKLDNPERAKENARKVRHTRRARQYKAGGSYTNEQIQELLIKQNFVCVYCDADLHEKRELDHRKAIARGGSNDISNLQWLCVSCNRKKRDKDEMEWLREIGKLPPETEFT